MTATTAAAAAATTADPYARFNARKTEMSAADETGDRFLRLLVAQVQNQDPLNPMDNAQVTTQMAQINTVNGIEKLNRSVQSLSGQFGPMHALQSVSLVGREVEVPGTRLAVTDGTARGGLKLDSAAGAVTVEVLGSDGRVLDTINLGARGPGTWRFEWDAKAASDPSNLSFRVVAKNGTADVAAQGLMRDRVTAVRTTADGITLDLARAGSVAQGSVLAFF